MKANDYLNQYLDTVEELTEEGWEEAVRKAYFDQTIDKSGEKEQVMDHIMNFQFDMVLPFAEYLESKLKSVYGTAGPVNPLLIAEQFMSVRQMSFIACSYCTTEALRGRKYNSMGNNMSRFITDTMRTNVFLTKKIVQEEKQSKLDKIDKLEKVGFELAELFFNRFAEYHNIQRDGKKFVMGDNRTLAYVVVKHDELSEPLFRVDEKPMKKNGKFIKGRTEQVIELTDECREVLNNSLGELGWEAWANPPMISEPNSWDRDGKNGGYYSEFMKSPLVKVHSDRLSSDYRHTAMSQDAINAVNAIQSTPWRINDYIYGVLKDLMETEPDTLSKLFPVDITPPEKTDEYTATDDIEWKDMTDNQKSLRRLFSDKVKYTKKANDGNGSRRISRNSSMEQADIYQNFDQFYFPYQVDYRGRIYSMAMSGLNPQGADAEKGLIELATGRMVQTLKGEQWLKINMANLMGFDKATLAERIEYTEGLGDMLRRVVSDPIVNTEWHEWDKPVQGLACANEYVKWLDDPNVELHTHVQLDGLCNGLQHLTAIANDDNAAPQLGLIESEERGDIYTFVQNAVEREVDRIIEKGPGDMDFQFAQEWRTSGQIDRDLCKKPVMTKGYSATLRGMEDGAIEKLLARGVNDQFEDYKKAGKWMAGVIWKSMDEAVYGACKVMEWFQSVASIVGKAERALEWTTPNGSGCYYAPRTSKSTEVSIRINLKEKKFKKLTATEKMHTHSLKSGISPNVIHSFDASHLMMTTAICFNRGIKDFAFVHDSFGTHPDDAQHMLDGAKEAWVDIYSENQLDRLYDEWCAIYAGHDIPHWGSFVKLGTLDASRVEDSDFFFA